MRWLSEKISLAFKLDDLNSIPEALSGDNQLLKVVCACVCECVFVCESVMQPYKNKNVEREEQEIS